MIGTYIRVVENGYVKGTDRRFSVTLFGFTIDLRITSKRWEV